MKAVPIAPPEGHIFLAIGPNCYGTGLSVRDAIKEAKRHATWTIGREQSVLVFVVPSHTFVDEMGYIRTPAGHAVRECLHCRIETPLLQKKMTVG